MKAAQPKAKSVFELRNAGASSAVIDNVQFHVDGNDGISIVLRAVRAAM